MKESCHMLSLTSRYISEQSAPKKRVKRSPPVKRPKPSVVSPSLPAKTAKTSLPKSPKSPIKPKKETSSPENLHAFCDRLLRQLEVAVGSILNRRKARMRLRSWLPSIRLRRAFPTISRSSSIPWTSALSARSCSRTPFPRSSPLSSSCVWSSTTPFSTTSRVTPCRLFFLSPTQYRHGAASRASLRPGTGGVAAGGRTPKVLARKDASSCQCISCHLCSHPGDVAEVGGEG